MINNNDEQLNKYLGVIHIHSKFSDGTGDINTITKAAKKAGLDWIIITDHNNFEIEEGFINGVCVIKGEEISPNGCNHYVALGVNEYVSPDKKPEEFIQDVKAQGGFGFAVHPDESDYRKNKNKPIKWTDKKVIPDGIEIWNWFSTWGDNYCDKNIFTKAFAYFFKNKLITKPKEETLRWWDELNKNSENIVPAIGGVDAHALKINDYIVPLTIFPYDEMFKTITNVIRLKEDLSKDFATAKTQILGAIKEGNNLIYNRNLCKKVPEINLDNSILTVKLGRKFEIKVLCNGGVIWSNKTKQAEIKLVKSGKYRVEIGLGKLGYAYSNPIRVM